MIRKLIALFLLFSFFSCFNDDLPSNCLRPSSLNILKSLNTPELAPLLTTDSFVEINGGYKGIAIFRTGNNYFAYDRICPKNDCDSPMSINRDLGFLLKCNCDNSEYSVILGGIPKTEGFNCPAIQYNVSINGNSLRISN
jgi:nitrite reductase/ring-hydroxylating ferredoxin subunit